MESKPDNYWNEAIVKSYLVHAASIHRRLPGVRVSGYRTLWPKTLKDDWERLYDIVNRKPEDYPPMPAEVTFHEEVMEWLQIPEQEERKIVWMRANKIPWKILVEEFDRSRPTLWGEQKRGVCRIETHLRLSDPDGSYFRQLRGRAGVLF